MKKLALIDIIGKRFENSTHSVVVDHFDPISETFILSGFDKERRDPITAMRRDLVEFDIEFTPNDAERKVIAESKMTNQVRKHAEQLQKSMLDWLNAGSVGR